jgi:hypothetical protein
MQAWVDLKLVQWAYAHHNSNVCDVNKDYKCSVVIPRETRYKSTAQFYDDQEILMNFEDEKYLTLFLLRFS